MPLARPLLFALLALPLLGCPGRKEVTEELGGRPKVMLDRARDGAERANEQAEQKRREALGE